MGGNFKLGAKSKQHTKNKDTVAGKMHLHKLEK